MMTDDHLICRCKDDDAAAREAAHKAHIKMMAYCPPYQIKYLESIDPSFKRASEDWNYRRGKLKEIHAKILEKEEIFRKDRTEWVADHRVLYNNKNEFFVERCLWEAKFEKDHIQPLYKERCDVAQGLSRFWLTAMFANKILSKQIKKHDKEALTFLKDITSCRTEDMKGFELKFIFSANPYFENEFLTKKYEVKVDNNQSITLNAIGTEINWYPSKNLTENDESFFNFFDTITTITYHNRVYFDEAANELKGKLPMDYVTGATIRNRTIPHAISWYYYKEEDDSYYSDWP